MIEADREGFKEWLGFPCDIEAKEEILSVECVHVEAPMDMTGKAMRFFGIPRTCCAKSRR